MRDGEPKTIRLRDYRAPVMQIRRVDLQFDLKPGSTTVTNTMQIERTQEKGAADIRLDGQELELLEISVDGETLSANAYQLDEDSLTLFGLPEKCEVRVVNRIEPEQNTALEGLYKSGGMYCTQCEAEGFRKITYYQDRPDVLATFTTTITAAADYPVMLSNGNLIADAVLADGRRQVTWQDPFPKPSYLFALVAGDLAVLEDSFTTMSGREVKLAIYSEPHNIDQCDYAMAVLKRSMRWDEERFGREYDLDIFMIVAVEDFNMGAMENKGLNLFNTSAVLATPDTATDQIYQRIEGVVAHEYFHNWSGNRVTCRDWFQLSLKEGFTVFRDAEFSSDMNSRTMKRIEDVSFLRSVQFAEDAGPLSHPIRPDSYIEISNFYTPTVYEKGAEIIGMLHTILGEQDFRRGSDLYFDRHDGQAATTDDFLAAMAEASGRDLDVFRRWYSQAGTPVLSVVSDWSDGTLQLTLQQSCPPTPGQPEKLPLHMPVAIGFIDPDGNSVAVDTLNISSDCDCDTRGDNLIVHLLTASTKLEISGLAAQSAISVLRGFSAPVRLDYPRSPEQLKFLAIHDPDGFAAWDALQTLLVAEVQNYADQGHISKLVIDLFGALLEQALHSAGEGSDEDRFMLAARLTLPTESYLFEQFESVDVDGICAGRDALQQTLAREHSAAWQALYQAAQPEGGYQPDAAGMSRRALCNLALSYAAQALPGAELTQLVEQHYVRADNLTDRRAALVCAVHATQMDAEVAARLLTQFLQRFQSQALVVNQWFAIQAGSPKNSAADIRSLAQHAAFDIRNPNKVRSLFSVFMQTNLRNYHAADGSGYQLIVDTVNELNDINPQVASALAKPLTRWRRFSGARSQRMRQALEQLAATDNLSPDVFEVVHKGLTDG